MLKQYEMLLASSASSLNKDFDSVDETHTRYLWESR